jgi:NAD(P)H dehydrogenase (quinone)
MPAKKPTVLVTGASGQLSRMVIDLLLERDAGPIIAVSRTPEKLAPLQVRGVETRKGDFDDPASLEKAFAGADRVLIVSTDGVGRPGGRVMQHVPAVRAAAAAGVGHVVYTSATAPTPTSRDSVLNDHYWTEVALAESKLPGWTVLRNNIYTDMLLRGLPAAIASGQLFSATGKGGLSYVTRADCAAAAAGALADGFAGKRILDVTGPAPVTQDEIAAMASELTGKTVRHVALGGADLRTGLINAGVPHAYADALTDFDVAAAQGYHAIVTPAVKDLGGKAPTSVREFLTANRQALAPAA